MIQLSSIPAFGFETTFCNANMYRSRHGGTSLDTYNISKKGGYIPILGTLVGLIRLIDVLDKKSLMSKVPNKFSHVIRGSIEFLSLGFLLIIPDFILTKYRDHKAKKAFSVNLQSDPTAMNLGDVLRQQSVAKANQQRAA